MEIATVLCYEATRDAKLEDVTLETPLEKMGTGIVDEDNHVLFHTQSRQGNADV